MTVPSLYFTATFSSAYTNYKFQWSTNSLIIDYFLQQGRNNWHFYFSIFVTLNFNPCLFHYKSLVIFYCFTWLFSLAEVKANSAVLLKKRLWLNHLFMTLLSTETQTQLYRTKHFHELKFAVNLQHALFFRIFQVSRKRRWELWFIFCSCLLLMVDSFLSFFFVY